jgi:hypothetical protein
VAAASVMTDVFDSPAVLLLLALEAREIHVELTADGRLIVEPASRLTADEQAAVRAHARELARLLGICDRGVWERRDAFAAQIAHARPSRLPACLLRPQVPYVKGTCFSCGVVLQTLVFGRCWRCALACRLAGGLSIPVDLIAAMDVARVIA